MTKVRDILAEAYSRANLCPRKKDLSADEVISGLTLLNGILQEYSSNNFITAYRNDVDFHPETEKVVVGSGDSVDVTIDNIQTPISVFFKRNAAIDWTPMEFISYNQFFSCGNSDYCVSWQPTGQNEYTLYFKPRFLAQNMEVKLLYSIEMILNDNDQVNLPTPYVELFTRALAYKLSVKYPRVNPEKQNRLKEEKIELEQQLEAANASNRIITRDIYSNSSLLQNFITGRFIYG